jgi:hypothetical protein
MRLFFAGGGHSDGANNGVHVYDFSGDAKPVGFSTLAGSRSDYGDVYNYQNDGTDVIQDGTYYDGRPSAVHTYSQVWWDAATQSVYRGGSGLYAAGSGGKWVWQFNPATQQWSRATEASKQFGGYGVLIGSPDGTQILSVGAVLTHSLLGPNSRGFLDVATGIVTESLNTIPWSGTDNNAVVCYDSTRGRHVTIARTTGSSTLHLHYLDINWSGKTVTWTAITPTGPATYIAELKGGMAFFYDPVRDSFFGFGSRDDMANDTFDKLIEIDAQTFEVVVTPLSMSLPTGGKGRGTFGRFLWMQQYRTVATIYSYNTPAALIRLPG